MRYILLILFITSISMCFAQDSKLPKKGYEWDVAVGLSPTFTREKTAVALDLSTVHGYRFNPRIFLGVGVATSDTQFLATYAQFNWAMRKPSAEKTSYPLLYVKAGYNVSTWGGESHFADEIGVYFEPVLAWSFYSKLGNLRYNVFLGLNYFNVKFTPKAGLSFTF